MNDLGHQQWFVYHRWEVQSPFHVLKREATVIILTTSYNGGILLAGDEVQAEDGERYSRQNDA